RHRVRGFRGRGNRRLGRVPLRRLRLRRGRPSSTAAVPDVRRHDLGESPSTLRGLSRAARGEAAAGILPEVTGLLDVDPTDARLRAPSLAALVRAVTAAGGSPTAADALVALAKAAQAVAGAEIALVRA